MGRGKIRRGLELRKSRKECNRKRRGEWAAAHVRTADNPRPANPNLGPMAVGPSLFRLWRLTRGLPDPPAGGR